MFRVPTVSTIACLSSLAVRTCPSAPLSLRTPWVALWPEVPREHEEEAVIARRGQPLLLQQLVMQKGFLELAALLLKCFGGSHEHCPSRWAPGAREVAALLWQRLGTAGGHLPYCQPIGAAGKCLQVFSGRMALLCLCRKVRSLLHGAAIKPRLHRSLQPLCGTGFRTHRQLQGFCMKLGLQPLSLLETIGCRQHRH